MTNEEINSAIIKACGWRQSNLANRWLVPTESKETSFYVGNPVEDLNAMHEAEKTLKLAQFWDYADTLNRLVDGSLGKDSYIAATARQRAEAFLRTRNLWTE